MSSSRQWDGLQFETFDLPYNLVLRELSTDPRLVSGSTNSYVTYGGKLVKRPGTIQADSTVNTTLTKRMDRLWMYETLDTPAIIYLLASVFDSGASTWSLQYIRMDAGGTPAWASAGSLRDLNASTRPHELVVSRGLAFVKGFPAGGSSEKLGTVVFDGTGGSPSVTVWGALGPSTPARISGAVRRLNEPTNITASQTTFHLDANTGLPAAPFNVQVDFELMTATAISGSGGSTQLTVLRGAQGTVAAPHTNNTVVLYRDWTASAHPVAVNLFWEYSYAYKDKLGNITNRAPAELNPDNLPSLTGPFLNLIPKITVQGLADTTNFPTIVIYRTTDGGGTLMHLDEITNTGSGSITYQDNTLASSAGNDDPQPDNALDSTNLAPSLTSNGPPPTVLAPKVVGTDTPAASTPIASYAGRLWYGIGNVVFYSANEEINVGIPECAWPSGLFGNFYRFQHPVVNLVPTSTALYVITTKTTYMITGTNKETFNPQPVLTNIGGAIGHPRAATVFGDTVVWLTNDLRIAILQGVNFRTISETLGLDFVSLINTKSAEIDIKYFSDLEKEWISVTAICPTPTDTRTWIYDIQKSTKLRKDFWNSPWNIQASAVIADRLRETQQQNRLAFFTWTGSTGFLTRVAVSAAENTGTDAIPSALNTINFRVKTNLFEVIPGNHINALRGPGVLPVIQELLLERTAFANDVDPKVSYYLNDLWTTPVPTLPSVGPARDDPPKGYSTLIYPVNTKGKRIAIDILKNDTDLFEVQNFSVIWNSDGGSSI